MRRPRQHEVLPTPTSHLHDVTLGEKVHLHPHLGESENGPELQRLARKARNL